MHGLETTYWWHRGMRTIMDTLLEPTITFRSRLVDIGCGTGGRLEALSRRCETWGIDYHQRAVELCCQRGLQNIVQGDAAHLPYPDDMFTHAVCCEVLQNIEDDAGAVREAFRVLEPGGLYYVSEQAYPILRGEHDISQEALRRYTRHRLTEMLTSAGFTVERMTHANTTLFPLMASVRLVSRLRHPPESIDPEASRSDLKALMRPANAALRRMLEMEAGVIRRGRDLPYGLTIIALARKPQPAELA